MPTKTHDNLINETIQWAKSLGYEVLEHHMGTETGADAIFQNIFGDKVILEVVTGSNFINLFKKQRIQKALTEDMLFDKTPEFLGLIVVGDRIDNIKKHGVEAGLPEEVFSPYDQKVFPVLVRNFKELIPVLLVSILGSRASAYGRFYLEDA